MSWRRIEDMSWKRLQDVFSITIFCLPRRFQDVFKTSSRCLQDVMEDEKLLRWRRFQDVFKTCLEDVFKTSWRPANVCWVTNNFFSLKRYIFHKLDLFKEIRLLFMENILRNMLLSTCVFKQEVYDNQSRKLTTFDLSNTKHRRIYN